MDSIQKNVYDDLINDLNIEIDPGLQIDVTQSQANIPTPFSLNDVAVGIFSAIGATAATLAKKRGLPSQTFKSAQLSIHAG